MKSFLLIILLFVGLNLSAKKFVIEEFFHQPTDISARRNPKTDINGDQCALIQIFTDLNNLEFDSNLGITEAFRKSNGEIWVYVSPGEKRLEISAPDFMPRVFNFPIAIESLSVYAMQLTSDDEPIRRIEGKGGISINTNPEGAKVMIEGMPGNNWYTPLELDSVMAVDLNVILSKERYNPIDTVVTVEAEKNSSYMFNLEPKFSDVSISTEPSGAMVIINDSEAGRTPLSLTGAGRGLSHGKHTVIIQHRDCYTFNRVIEVKPEEENDFSFELSQINGTISVRTTPPGANVYVDSTFLGITPIFNNKINMGNKIIDISKEGYTSIRHKMSIEEDEDILLIDTLQESQNVIINTNPEGARFYRNGNYMGITPVRIPMVLGTNEYTFKKTDYVDQHIQEDINGDKLKYEYDLDLQQYEVEVLSEPDGANVYIHGELKGVTPCKVYLPNDKIKIKYEKIKYIPISSKVKPGDTDFVVKQELRKRIKESRTVGFSLEKWNASKDYKARFDVGNFLILKLGWNQFQYPMTIGETRVVGIENAEVAMSPTFHVTKYGEISPFLGVGYETGMKDSTDVIQNMIEPVISSLYYTFGSYFYVNLHKNAQVYLQIAKLNPIENEVKYDDSIIERSIADGKQWNDFFEGRFALRTAFGIRLRLGGYN